MEFTLNLLKEELTLFKKNEVLSTFKLPISKPTFKDDVEDRYQNAFLKVIKNNIPIKPLFNNLYTITFNTIQFIFHSGKDDYTLVGDTSNSDIFNMLLSVGLLPYDSLIQELPTKTVITSYIEPDFDTEHTYLTLKEFFEFAPNRIDLLRVDWDTCCTQVLQPVLPIGDTGIEVISSRGKLFLRVTPTNYELLKLITKENDND